MKTKQYIVPKFTVVVLDGMESLCDAMTGSFGIGTGNGPGDGGGNSGGGPVEAESGSRRGWDEYENSGW